MKECVLIEDKTCNNCGECFKCDIDPAKICNNCGVCIGLEADYRAIEITDILWQQEGPDTLKPEIKPLKFSEKPPKKESISRKSIDEITTVK